MRRSCLFNSHSYIGNEIRLICWSVPFIRADDGGDKCFCNVQIVKPLLKITLEENLSLSKIQYQRSSGERSSFSKKQNGLSRNMRPNYYVVKVYAEKYFNLFVPSLIIQWINYYLL